MKLFAQLDHTGTAMSETALCRHHLPTHRTHMERRTEWIGEQQVPLDDVTFHDCSSNEELRCNVCNASGNSPDLAGRTIDRVEFYAFRDDGQHYLDEPVMTLHFTDGTKEVLMLRTIGDWLPGAPSDFPFRH